MLTIPRLFAPFLHLSNTPQVDTSTCNYVRRKTRATVVGRGRRICSSLVIPKLPAISPSKKTGTVSFPRLMTDGKRDNASIQFYCGFMLCQKDRSGIICFAVYLIYTNAFVLKCVLFLLCNKDTYIRRCICPADGQRETGNRRTKDHLVSHTLDWPISEGDQEKNGNRPATGKPQKTKTEKQKPEQKGNKGKRKGKSPRTEELISSIMQKSGFLSSTHHSANLPDCVGFQQY